MGVQRDRNAASAADGGGSSGSYEPLIADSITNPPVLLLQDEAPVEIRLDDNNNHIPPPASSAPPGGSGADVPPAYSSPNSLGTPFVGGRPRMQRKMTPLGTYPLNLPGALLEAGLIYNPNFALLEVALEQAPLPAAAAPEAVSLTNPSSSATSTTGAQPPPSAASVSIDSVSVPSVNDFLASKPHTDAVFVPETLEWRVVADQSRICKRPLLDDQVARFDAIFEACGLATGSVRVYETVPTTIPAAEQLSSIPCSGGESTAEAVEEFSSHKCWITGCRILSTPPDTITTVIDRQLLNRFRENRESNPAIGITPRETFVRALRVLVRIVGNAAHGNRRLIVTHGATITQKLVYDDVVREIFAQLGWPVEVMPADGRMAIKPIVGTADASGSDALRRLLRTWIELQLWLDHETAQLQRESPASSLLSQPNPAGAIVTKILSRDAKPSLLTLLDYRSDQVDHRYGQATNANRQAFEFLGVPANSPDNLVKFAYLVKLEISPDQGGMLLSCVETIQSTQRQDSQLLKELLAWEKSNGRFTTRDLDKAYEQLQLSERELGGAVLRGQIPHDFIVDSYRARLHEAVSKGDASDYHGAKEALRVISLSQGRPQTLQQAYEAQFEMDVEQAYALLELSRDIDDSTVLVVHHIRVADAPGKTEMLRDAFHSVAEDRKSDFLREFVKTGKKPDDSAADDGWQQMPSENRPAGINNIGNTCYLNSVLQYFFTIREIRERIFQLAAQQQQQKGSKQTGTASRSRRVGGRKVSAREIERSTRFVMHLAELFHQLIHTPDLAVTPKRELAYLALVSSRAEEDVAGVEDAVGTATTPKADPKQAVLHDEPTSISPSQEKMALSAVAEEGLTHGDKSEAESMDQSDITQVTAPPSGAAPVEPASTASATASSNTANAANVPLPPSRAVTMDASSPVDAALVTPSDIPLPASRAATLTVPPLPQRPRRTTIPAAVPEDPTSAPDNIISDNGTAAAVPPPARQNSLMQLGAQQDVSECLDNCLFQLEIALAAASQSGDSVDSKNDANDGDAEEAAHSDQMDLDATESAALPVNSLTAASEDLLSKLFLGKTCQQLELVDQDATKGPRPSIHTKKEVFKILPVDVVEEGRDLYDGLDGFFDEETLIGSEGKPVRRTVTLLEPPPLLQIQLQRVQYDRETMRAFKSQAHLAMYETLYMDRYLDFDPADPADQVRLEKRRKTREARRTIGALRARLAELKPMGRKTVAQSLVQTEQVLKDLAQLPPLHEAKMALGIDSFATSSHQMDTTTTTTTTSENTSLSTLITPDLLSFLETEHSSLVSELSEAERTISSLKTSMTSLWSDETRAEYSLAAVFMHRGEASHGHYFLNQRKLGGASETNGSTWFRYNDSQVSTVSAAEVLRDTSGATPYLVTYVRKDLQDSIGLVDTVQRIIDAHHHTQPQQQEEEEQKNKKQRLSSSPPSVAAAATTTTTTAATTATTATTTEMDVEAQSSEAEPRMDVS